MFGEPIATYSRAEAIEDGVLVDVTADAQRVGFRVPVAVTSRAHAALGLDNERTRAQALAGLVIAWSAAPPADHVEVTFTTPTGDVEAWAAITPGDDGAPVVTLMLRGED